MIHPSNSTILTFGVLFALLIGLEEAPAKLLIWYFYILDCAFNLLIFGILSSFYLLNLKKNVAKFVYSYSKFVNIFSFFPIRIMLLTWLLEYLSCSAPSRATNFFSPSTIKFDYFIPTQLPPSRSHSFTLYN